MRVAIIGGGIAGLAAAYELARRDSTEAVLFEAGAHLGGIVGTVRRQGFVLEEGPDAWVSEKPWARELAEELGLGAELIPSLDHQRKTYIAQQGKLIAMPEGMRMMVPADLDAMRTSPLFTAEAKRACEAEPARADELRACTPVQDESVASFVRRHFGEEMLHKVGAPLLSGVFGGDVETLSVRSVMPQFVAMEREYGSLIAAVQAKQKTASAAIFTSLRSGIGTLIDALVERIPASWIRRNTPVASLQRSGEGWSVNGEAFDIVLLAAPVHIAQSLLAPIDAQAAALMQMDSSSAVTVSLAFAEDFDLPPGFGFLVPDDGASPLLACTFTDQKFPGRAPAGTRLLRAFFGGSGGERALALDDATLGALARTELAPFLGQLPAPAFTVVRRLPRSLPQYAVGHLDRMAELAQRVQALGGLYLLGNGYRGVGLPDLIRDARAAAVEVTA